MSYLVKLVSVVAMSAGFSAVTLTSAHALSVISPAYQDQANASSETYSHPPVAFTGGKGEASSSGGFSLSPQEIKHVQWCAKTYVSYHASDDTYETAKGTRAACDSPF